jgi:hypothetical protein
LAHYTPKKETLRHEAAAMLGRVVFAIILFCGIVAAYFQVDGALDTLRRHAPNPEELIQVGGTSMRQIDALCLELLPKVERPNSVRSFLICHHHKRLVPMLFVLASMTGWCASVWLIALQHKAGAPLEGRLAFVVSLLLAFLSGIICYLILLLLPLGLLGAKTPESASAFPLLAGLFLRVFFQRLPDVLSAVFDRLTGRRSGENAGGDNGAGVPTLVLLATVSVLSVSQVYGRPLYYYRCADPKDKCIAFTEEQKADCPECRRWYQETLDFSELIESADAEQKSAGIHMKTLASNYFIAAISKKLYDVDVTAGGTEAPPKAAAIYKAPEKFGFRQLTEGESKVGSIALFGNLAGVVIREEEGKVTIAYPSATTGELSFARSMLLADQKNALPKYIVPRQRFFSR